MSAVPNVLCIAGSPRRNGNSDRLLARLEQGVRDGGGEPVHLVAADVGIDPCTGSNACSATGRCMVRDGMDAVYPLLDAANAIAVATPVYFASVPASLKALYDRCQPYWARRYVLGEPSPAHRRPGAIIVVGGGGGPFGTTCAVTPTRSVFGLLGISVDHVLEAVGPDAPGDIEVHEEWLAEAHRIGVALAHDAVHRAG